MINNWISNNSLTIGTIIEQKGFKIQAKSSKDDGNLHFVCEFLAKNLKKA